MTKKLSQNNWEAAGRIMISLGKQDTSRFNGKLLPERVVFAKAIRINLDKTHLEM